MNVYIFLVPCMSVLLICDSELCRRWLFAGLAPCVSHARRFIGHEHHTLTQKHRHMFIRGSRRDIRDHNCDNTNQPTEPTETTEPASQPATLIRMTLIAGSLAACAVRPFVGYVVRCCRVVSRVVSVGQSVCPSARPFVRPSAETSAAVRTFRRFSFRSSFSGDYIHDTKQAPSANNHSHTDRKKTHPHKRHTPHASIIGRSFARILSSRF